MKICDMEKCTGCFSCMSSCPHQAISVGTDRYGKTIPRIDPDKCRQCGACLRSCPVNQMPELRPSKRALAAWSKAAEDVARSSSGGAAAVFARRMLEQGGVVYGAAALDGGVRHVRVEDSGNVDLLRGSKYVQSQMGTIHRQVREDLTAGRRVLFLGVPCQIAGLLRFLHRDYPSLVTVELICHGTPPLTYLQEYAKDQAGENWDRISFRGQRDWFLTIYEKDRVVYSRRRDQDLYFTAFLDQLTYRDNCYSCPYAQPNRCADLTIGDFWGIDRSSLSVKYGGRISLILTNTDKGEEFWSLCQDGFVWEERPLEEARNPEQGNLLHPSSPHPDRTLFLETYERKGFTEAVRATEIGALVRSGRIHAFLYENPVGRTWTKVRNKSRLLWRRYVRRDST